MHYLTLESVPMTKKVAIVLGFLVVLGFLRVVVGEGFEPSEA